MGGEKGRKKDTLALARKMQARKKGKKKAKRQNRENSKGGREWVPVDRQSSLCLLKTVVTYVLYKLATSVCFSSPPEIERSQLRRDQAASKE